MSTEGSKRPRRLVLSKRTAYVLVAVGAVLVLLISSGWIDVVTYPWARSLTGSPVLVGTWKGDLVVVGAETRPMALTIKRPEYRSGGRCSNCASMEGLALVCVPGGAPDELDIGGWTRNWRGTQFTLKFGTTGKRTPGTYAHLGEMRGEWDGGDTIRLSGEPYPVVVNPDASTTTTSHSDDPDPHVTFELRRAAEGETVQSLRCA